ncbi:hypothetical protein cypCar_00046524, partial [Cyprinus carpio]
MYHSWAFQNFLNVTDLGTRVYNSLWNLLQMFMMSKTPSHVPLSHAPKPVESNADVLDVPKAPSNASLSAKVELAHGTGIKILKHQWTSALQAQTATSMVRVLLMAAFPLEVLIHSNLKGGKSKTD